MAGKILIPGVNFEGGGGGSDPADILEQLKLAELNLISPGTPNQIIDSFDTDTKGTKVNTAASLDALRLTGSNLTGSYQRDRLGSAPVDKVAGVVVASLQALAPKNVAVASNVFKFSGDVTAFFPNTKSVLIAKKVSSDGDIVHKFLANAAGNIAELAVSSSYNLGLDETSVTVTNPESLDLDLDVIAANYNATLRIIPFDWTVEAKSVTAASLERLVIYDAFGSNTINITGENTFKEVGALTATALKHCVKFSPNGQYGVLQIAEYASPYPFFRFYGTADNGNTWTLLGSKVSGNHANSVLAEANPGQQYINNAQIVVADNGKWLSAYWFYSAFQISSTVRAVCGDLTISSFADTGATSAGVPGGRPGGTFGAGIIADGGNNRQGIALADLTDLSLAGVMEIDSAGTATIVFFSGGGTTHIATASFTSSDVNIKASVVVGTAGSRRVWVSTTLGSNQLIIFYFQESDLYQSFYSATGVVSTSTQLSADGWLIDNLVFADNKIAAAYYKSGYENFCFRIVNNAAAGTPSISSENNLTGGGQSFAGDGYIGWTSVSPAHWYRTYDAVVHFDGTRLTIAQDMAHGDAIRRPMVYEVRDVDSFQGFWVGLGTVPTSDNYFRYTSATTQFGQTFLATTNRIRTASVRVGQTGLIAAGHLLTCELQETTGGFPNGVVVATAINSYDPRTISRTNEMHLFFNFNSPTVVNGNTYALVFKSTFPISTTNYLNFRSVNTNNYPSGSMVKYDGSVWTNETNHDLFFRIYGEWVYDHSEFCRTATQEFGVDVWCQETQIKRVDITNNTLRLATRRMLSTTVNQRTQTGHPFTKTMNLGSVGVASTFTDYAVAGYFPSNYDKNLILNLTHGEQDTARIVNTTGVVSSTNMSEDRSGLDMTTTYNNISGANYVADVTFSTGKALSLNGSNQGMHVAPGTAAPLQLGAYPFVIEAEFNCNLINTTLQNIVGAFDTGSNYGWYLGINNGTSGRIEFYLTNSGGSSIGHAYSNAGVIVSNTTYVARVTYDGLGGAPKIFLSTTGPSGTFTEITYAAQQAVTGTTAHNTSICIGKFLSGGGSSWFSGKLGYAKVAKIATSFNFIGW
jgi:hypothetical protein